MSDDNNNILDNLTEDVVEEASTTNSDFDDFDFIEDYSESAEVKHENQLDD